ncbi:hypothetical protein [Brumicola pallidula]|uniref:hypothetical protein n=1 Tax=Brumicola pallidula TaxID=56807 RepID=UPI00047A36D4|nr:hypothetical protein [Glaciecola pallidula]
MKEELIMSVANILEKWNPLGEQASAVNGLDGYYTEAIDILSSSSILKEPIIRIVAAVLTEAFDITLDKHQLEHYSKKIEQKINEH